MNRNNTATIALLLLASSAFGANPLFTDTWTADPAPFVDGDTIYVYAGHDAAKDGEMFNMPDWVCYSSKDLKTWKSHGALLKSTDFPCGGEKSAWASQVVKKGGRYYWYVTYTHTNGGGQSVGVAVADSPLGPWKPHSKPVVTDQTTPSPYWGNDIDPTVLVDDDGTAWMAWGNPVCYLAKLSADMLSIDGEISVVPLPNYTEGPWLDKRGKTYFLIYASRAHQGCGEHMDYATAPSPKGPWTYRGRLTGGARNSYTIHPGLARFKGRDILFYHNATLVLNGMGGGTGRRCVTAEWADITNGTIKPFEQTEEGLSKAPGGASEASVEQPRIKQPQALADGFAFREFALAAMAQTPMDSFVKWGRNAVYKSVENPFMDSPQCDGFNLGEKSVMSEKFKLESDLRLFRIDLYLTDGEGTGKDDPLRIVLRTGDKTLFDVPVEYTPQGYGVAALGIRKEYQPLLKAGAEYTLELCGRKWSHVAYWRRGWNGDKPHGFALYGKVGAKRGGEKAEAVEPLRDSSNR